MEKRASYLPRRFMVVSYAGKVLPVSLFEHHCSNSVVIIWRNEGLYGLLTRNTLEPILSVYRDACKLPQLDTNKDSYKVHWDDMVPLDAKVAKLLFE